MADYRKIRAALDNGLKAFNAANLVNGSEVPIAWENTRFEPTDAGVAYQEATLLPANTQQPGNGGGGTQFDTGIFQISLYYPRDEGPGAAAGRADLLRSHFGRGTLLSYDGVTVQVERTPSISPARITDSWYILVVSVPYFVYS